MIAGLEILFFVLFAIIMSLVHRHRRKKRVDNDLTTYADQLGLARIGNELVGRIDGVPVGARLAIHREGSSHQARWTLFARLEPPLDMGLSLHSRGYKIEEPSAGTRVVSLPGGAFRQRFEAFGDEPRRVRALINEKVRSHLMKALSPGTLFMLNDSGCAAQGLQSWANEKWLRDGLGTVASIANQLNSARDNAPVAAELAEQRAAWASFAASNGLHGISAPLCMWGTLLGATIYAYTIRRKPHEYQLEVWMRFERPLGLGLLLQPMRTVDRFKDFFGAEDHRLGDADFDDTFLLRVSDAPGTEALLDKEMRGRLLAMHGTVGPLSLSDEGVSIRLPNVPLDPAVVPRLVRHLIEIADAVSDKRFAQRGPYR